MPRRGPARPSWPPPETGRHCGATSTIRRCPPAKAAPGGRRPPDAVRRAPDRLGRRRVVTSAQLRAWSSRPGDSEEARMELDGTISWLIGRAVALLVGVVILLAVYRIGSSAIHR